MRKTYFICGIILLPVLPVEYRVRRQQADRRPGGQADPLFPHCDLLRRELPFVPAHSQAARFAVMIRNGAPKCERWGSRDRGIPDPGSQGHRKWLRKRSINRISICDKIARRCAILDRLSCHFSPALRQNSPAISRHLVSAVTIIILAAGWWVVVRWFLCVCGFNVNLDRKSVV